MFLWNFLITWNCDGIGYILVSPLTSQKFYSIKIPYNLDILKLFTYLHIQTECSLKSLEKKQESFRYHEKRNLIILSFILFYSTLFVGNDISNFNVQAHSFSCCRKPWDSSGCFWA